MISGHIETWGALTVIESNIFTKIIMAVCMWILLIASAMINLVRPTVTSPLTAQASSRVTRSNASDKCFDDMVKNCTKILPAHRTLQELKNFTDKPWYHCECTNKLNRCINDALGPMDTIFDYPASDRYGQVTDYTCFREEGNSVGPTYESVTAPLLFDKIPIYW